MCTSDHILKYSIVLHILSDLREVMCQGWSTSFCDSSDVLTSNRLTNGEFCCLFLKQNTFQLNNLQYKNGLLYFLLGWCEGEKGVVVRQCWHAYVCKL